VNNKIRSQLDKIQNRIGKEQKKEKEIYNPSEVNYNDLLLDLHQITAPEKRYMEYLEA
jgi:hypothetical protein